MRAKLERCTITERRWNRKKVLHGSPDKKLKTDIEYYASEVKTVSHNFL